MRVVYTHESYPFKEITRCPRSKERSKSSFKEREGLNEVQAFAYSALATSSGQDYLAGKFPEDSFEFFSNAYS